jgi:mono/diheme cytochrome c family protein
MLAARSRQRRLAAATWTLGALVLAATSVESAQGTSRVQGAANPVGAQVYAKWCSDCHSTARGPGSMALQMKYQGQVPAILEQRRDLSADYIRLAVRKGISFMPSFRKTEISDVELGEVSAFLLRSPARGRVAQKRT